MKENLAKYIAKAAWDASEWCIEQMPPFREPEGTGAHIAGMQAFVMGMALARHVLETVSPEQYEEVLAIIEERLDAKGMVKATSQFGHEKKTKIQQLAKESLT